MANFSLRRIIWWSRIGVIALVSVPAFSQASVDICEPPAPDPYLSVAYRHHDTFSDEGSNAEIDRETSEIDMLFDINDDWSIGAGHRYNQLDARNLGLPTNGHLHTVFLPVHRQSRSDSTGFRFSIAPAMSSSSNVLKDPDEYSADAFQILAALVWDRELSEQTSINYGICGDHRFGGYRVYPVLGFNWRPGGDWLVEVGFPMSRLTWETTSSINMSLQVAPDGNEWHVENKNMDRQSQLIYEATLLEYRLSWSIDDRFTVSVSAGRSFDIRYKTTLLNDTKARLTGDAVTRLGAAVAWRF